MNRWERFERMTRNWWAGARHWIKRRDSECRSFVLYVNPANENHTTPRTSYGTNTKVSNG